MAAEAFRQRSTLVSTIKVGPRQDTFSWQDYKDRKPCNELQVNRRVQKMYWALSPVLVLLAPFGFDFFAPTPKGRPASTCRMFFTVTCYLLKALYAVCYLVSLLAILDRMAGIIDIRWINTSKYKFGPGEITVATVALQLISYLLATVNYLFVIYRERKIRQVLQDSVVMAVQRTDDRQFKSACRRVTCWTVFFAVVVLFHFGNGGYATSTDVLRGSMTGNVKDVEANATVVIPRADLIYVRCFTLLFNRFVIYPFKDCLVCLFCLVCIFARICFSHLITPTDTRLVQVTGGSRQLQGEVSDLHGRHYKTASIVSSINDCFGFMVFVWISLGAIDLCSVSKLLCDSRAGNGPLAQMLVIALVSTVYILKLLLSSSLNTEVSESLSNIIRTTSKDEGVTRYPWSLEEKISTIYYCTSLHFHTPAVTVWGFCCVTRGLVLTVAGTLFSFVLTLCNIG